MIHFLFIVKENKNITFFIMTYLEIKYKYKYSLRTFIIGRNLMYAFIRLKSGNSKIYSEG
jgi:hypothetical protein